MDAKDSFTKLSLIIVLIILMCGLAVGQSETFQVVKLERIPEILRTISIQTKENFERIHTWQYEMEGSRYIIDKGEQAKRTFEIHTNAVGPCPNEVAEIDSSRVIFRCDLDKELSYSKVCRNTPIRYLDLADSRDLGAKSGRSCGSYIVMGEYQLSANPNAWRKGEVIERKAIKQKIEKDDSSCGGHQPVYLPRYLFDIESQVWVRGPRLMEIIEEKGEHVVNGLSMKVEQRTLSGDVQYRVHEPFVMNVFDINNVWEIKTFSANAGYNIISSEMTTDDGKLMHQESIEYQDVNGVYVPSRRTKDTFDYRDFSLSSHKENVFKNVRINEAIPAETFTYKNLGLKNGDKFIDKVLDKEYTYQNEQLIAVEKKSK